MADWITAKNQADCSRLYSFRKEFTCSSADSFKIRVSADSRYKLYINGHFISEGPCRSSGKEKYFETVDAAPFVKAGKNIIEAVVLNIREFSWESVIRSEKCALWFDGMLVKNGEETPIASNTDWECAEIKHISFREAKVGMAFTNQYETLNLPEKTLCYEQCQLLYTPKPNFCTGGGILDRYFLKERPIPPMYFGKEESFDKVKDGIGFIELDARRLITADFRLSFKAKKGSRIKIIYSECRYPEDAENIMTKGLRDDPDGKIIGDFDEIISDGEVFEFVPYSYRTFRYVGIEFEPGSCFELVSCTFCPYHYPITDGAKFSCSDEALNQMWQVSLNTIKNCCHEIIEDCPYHEQQQYIMDSSLTMLYLFRIHSDCRLAKKAILEFCDSLHSSGFTAANFPAAYMQIIPGFSLILIKMIHDYYMYSGDIALVKKTVGVCETILNTFEELSREDNLIADPPFWKFIDWVDGWKNGSPLPDGDKPLTVYNMMYAAALCYMAKLYEFIGRDGSSADCLKKHAMYKSAINSLCYNSKEGLYENRPGSNTYSQHAQLWAVLGELVSKEEGKALISRMFEKQDIDKCSFAMNFFLFRALEKVGIYEKSGAILDNWKKMLDLHCTTWGESLSYPRSECHGWSSAPLYELSAQYLGVNPIEPGCKKVRINPYTDTLDFAEGEVPTPYGKIRVSWKKENGEVVLNVTAPKEITIVTDEGITVLPS